MDANWTALQLFRECFERWKLALLLGCYVQFFLERLERQWFIKNICEARLFQIQCLLFIYIVGDNKGFKNRALNGN